MSRPIFCVKLKKEGEGLKTPPYPGKLGERIYNEISKEAWQLWLRHQTLLINEHHLNMTDPKSRQFLLSEMENFLFGAGSATPPGYKANKHKSSDLDEV